MKNFQTIVLVAFGFFALVGVIAFSVQRATPSAEDLIPELTMWGTLPAEYFSFLGSSELEDPYLKKIAYREIREENFDQELIEALAEGAGPDIVVLSDKSLYEHRNKIQFISYEDYSASLYDESFMPLADIFLFEDGVAALPGVTDPMVMYSNTALLASRGYANPPQYWDEMRGFSESLTETEGFLNVRESAVSLGTFDNIDHAKDIVSLLLMQSGSPVVTREDGVIFADFSQTISTLSLPPSEALNFYTEFADPAREAYSWNTSLPSSRDMFLAGDLALYFGYVSERDDLVEANPNLAFDISLMPQVKDSPFTMTSGDVYGFAALKASDDLRYAYPALWSLSGPESVALIDERSGLPSVRNALATEDAEDPASRTILQSSLISRTWLDPDNEDSAGAFRQLISSVRSNELDPEAALTRLKTQIDTLLRQ